MEINSRSGMPDEQGIRDHLRQFQGATAFEIPTTDSKGGTPGNHGDLLLHKIFREISADCGIHFTSNVDEADILVVRPGGGLLEYYAFPTTLKARLSEYPDLPLVIFPSSTLFENTDPGEIFGARKAPTLFMLRERYSYDQLVRNWSASLAARNVSLVLDHDLVASGHARVRTILETAVDGVPEIQNGTLVAARLDVEARPISNGLPTISVPKQLLLGIYRKFPTRFQTALRKQIIRGRQNTENHALLNRVRTAEGVESAEALIIKKDSKDLSDQTLYSFSEYAQSILEAKRVITNRLHIALPSAALGTETYLVDSGYHKLRGVYEQSLTLAENIRLVPADE